MRDVILILSVSNVICFIIHELDAFYRQEWKMFKLLQSFKDSTQYSIFLYAHIPIVLLLLYYSWTVVNFNNFWLFIAINLFSLLHLILHLAARSWKSNVFHSIHSFIIIFSIGITGLLNLALSSHY